MDEDNNPFEVHLSNLIYVTSWKNYLQDKVILRFNLSTCNMITSMNKSFNSLKFKLILKMFFSLPNLQSFSLSSHLISAESEWFMKGSKLQVEKDRSLTRLFKSQTASQGSQTTSKEAQSNKKY